MSWLGCTGPNIPDPAQWLTEREIADAIERADAISCARGLIEKCRDDVARQLRDVKGGEETMEYLQTAIDVLPAEERP